MISTSNAFFNGVALITSFLLLAIIWLPFILFLRFSRSKNASIKSLSLGLELVHFPWDDQRILHCIASIKSGCLLFFDTYFYLTRVFSFTIQHSFFLPIFCLSPFSSFAPFLVSDCCQAAWHLLKSILPHFLFLLLLTGLTISGGLTLAKEEVNKQKLAKFNHSIDFIVSETYGEEISSIRQTASLWKHEIYGYIGPQETCNHEGRMAAAFNLPMISYFCTNYETSNKKDFPTFARTRPPDTQIAKSVASLLLTYNWTQVAFFHVDHESSEISEFF